MVKILEDNRPLSTAQRFGRAFSSIGESLPQALGEYSKDLEKQEKALAKRRAQLRPGVKRFLGLYDPDKAFLKNPENISRLEELSSKYLEQGLEPDDAIKLAYEEILGSPAEEASNDSNFFQYGKGSFSPNEEIRKKFSDFIFPNEENEQKKQRNGLGGFFGTPKGNEEGNDQARKLGLKATRPLVNVADLPLQAAKILQQFGNAPGQMGRKDWQTLTEMFDEATQGRGIPENFAERVLSAYPYGPYGIAAAAVGEGLQEIGAPAEIAIPAEILTFFLSRHIQRPDVKNFFNRVTKTAEQTGKSVEQVIEDASKASGISPQQIAQGDQAAIKALSQRITSSPEVSKKVQAAPKTTFNPKKAAREREIFGAKLAESPLEAHYASEERALKREAGKGRDIRAREAEIRARLEPEEKKLFENIRHKKDQLVRIEQERLKAPSEDVRGRLDTHHQYQLRSIKEDTEKLKDIQYEMKYGRPRPSEAEIDAQIQNSLKKYEEGIKNPSENTFKDVSKQLELDKQYIDKAKKIIERGELPGDIRPDTFIKMKQKYLDAYKEAIKDAKEVVRSLKGEADIESLRTIREKERLAEILETRVKRLQSDIINQTDKLKALGALEKPSGAFYKNQLKSLEKDHGLFKHDLFKRNVIKSPKEIKTEKIFSEKSPEFQKAKAAAENPSSSNIEKVAEETGKSKESIGEYLKRIRNEASSMGEKVKNGTLTPKDESKFAKRLRLGSMRFGAGFSLGALQALSEEYFGYKPTLQMLRYGMYVGTGAAGYSTLGGAVIGHKAIRSLFDNAQANELKKLKNNPAEWNRYVSNLRNRAGDAKVKRIFKIIKS